MSDSPSKAAVQGSGPAYTSVPLAGGSSPTAPTFAAAAGSGSYNDPYANLAGASGHLSPETPSGVDAALLRRDSDMYPAPSIISRDSTHASLPGTPSLYDKRQSWGSGVALAGAASGIAGAEGRPRAGRGQSTLNQSSGPFGDDGSVDRLSTSDEEDAQGHIAPGAAAAGALRGPTAGLDEKYPRWADQPLNSKDRKSRKGLWIGVGAGALLLLIGLGVGLGVGLTRNKSSSNASGSASNLNGGAASSGSAGSSGSNPSATRTATGSAASPTATSGTMGSLITLEDGTTMTYDNTFGGKWVWDPANPFNNEAQAQSYTPPLNQNWTWGVDKVHGVNLGGWLVTEPFIVSGLYETYANGPGNRTAVDEYTLSQNMGSNLTAAMTEHYETFITERDIAEIAAAGLNWVRIPIGHWAVQNSAEEAYLERVSWTYLLKAIKWCRKYGIRINLDLHTVPGSQNGWNHSGKIGPINWLNGAMGLANAQRALDTIRTLAQFISQPEYTPVIGMFGFINEPNANALGQGPVGAFYLEAYRIIREITGIGEGKGPMLSIHDGFLGIQNWFNFAPGADRLALDQHTYMVFVDQPQGTLNAISKQACSWWATTTNNTSNQYGVNVAGEWSAAMNDCGKWINSVGSGSRYDGSLAGYTGPTPGSCAYWNDHTQWNTSTKNDIQHFVKGSMDALQNYFFWTWKIGNSTGTIKEVNPFWHYRLGLQYGWIPKDPRDAVGTCAGDGVSGNDFSGTFSAQPWATGGAGAGTVRNTASYAWPPASFTSVPAASMSLLPQFTATGTPVTMPGPSFTSPGSTQTINAGNGMANPNAAQYPAYVPVAGCSYPPEYSAVSVAITRGACGAGLNQALPRATAAP